MGEMTPEEFGRILRKTGENSTLHRRVHHSAGSCAETLAYAVEFARCHPGEYTDRLVWLHGIAQQAARRDLDFPVNNPAQFCRLGGQLAYSIFRQVGDPRWWANAVEGFGLAVELSNDPKFRAGSALDLSYAVQESDMGNYLIWGTIPHVMHLFGMVECPEYEEKLIRHNGRLLDVWPSKNPLGPGFYT